eukprot:SAG25_NODE_113_length_14872_cov_23.149527_18_plen_174_part_00
MSRLFLSRNRRTEILRTETAGQVSGLRGGGGVIVIAAGIQGCHGRPCQPRVRVRARAVLELRARAEVPLCGVPGAWPMLDRHGLQPHARRQPLQHLHSAVRRSVIYRGSGRLGMWPPNPSRRGRGCWSCRRSSGRGAAKIPDWILVPHHHITATSPPHHRHITATSPPHHCHV